MAVPRSISVFDLKSIPGAIGIIQRNNKKEIDTLLYQYGFDIESGYDFVECNHRPLTLESNIPVFGVLIVGTERLCDEWINSGNASWEAVVTACKDPSMRADLRIMSQEYRNTEHIIDHISKNKTKD